jgi:hypothetical protein
MSLLPRSNGEVTVIGGFIVSNGLVSNPSTQTLPMGIPIPANSTGAQVPLLRPQPCVITKILITSNGGGEWVSGTQEFRMYKNAQRTGTPIFTSGAVAPADVPLTDDTQRQRWYDVNIPMTSENDYLTADWESVSVSGGPEGIGMTLWGVTGDVAQPVNPVSSVPLVGTNSNGTFWQYPDGRLICYASDPNTRTTGLAIGSVFRSSAWVATFPFPFVDVPVVQCGADYVSGTSLLGAGQAGAATTTQVTMRINGSVNSSVGRLNYVAYGRWK